METIHTNRMKEIEKITTELVSGINFEKSPYVDIVPLVEKVGFKVIPKSMPIQTTGCILVDENKKNNKRIIMVNTIFRNPENETDVIFKKSRFITAHEFGHFILHKKEGQPMYAHRDTYHRKDPLELEADYFARSLLLPIKQFKVYSSVLNSIEGNNEEFTVEMLSELFKITKNKIKKRMGDISVLVN